MHNVHLPFCMSVDVFVILFVRVINISQSKALAIRKMLWQQEE